MSTQRHHYPADFKARVALEALKEYKTINELASEYGVHPSQINAWKKQLKQELPRIFAGPRLTQADDEEALKARLYQQIGQLQVELDWLKKKADWRGEQQRQLIEPGHPHLSVARQCALVGLSRSSLYYQPTPTNQENLALMRLLDEQYTRTPFYGSPRMTAWLRTQGYAVHHKRVARLMLQMGLQAIYPRARARSAKSSGRYPYLLTPSQD